MYCPAAVGDIGDVKLDVKTLGVVAVAAMYAADG
jgi:hypothetical protein